MLGGAHGGIDGKGNGAAAGLSWATGRQSLLEIWPAWIRKKGVCETKLVWIRKNANNTKVLTLRPAELIGFVRRLGACAAQFSSLPASLPSGGDGLM